MPEPGTRRRWVGRFLLVLGCLVAAGPSFCHQRSLDHLEMVFIDTPAGGYLIDLYEYPNRLGARPLNYVNLPYARKACADAGKRLCTDAEWRRACQGPSKPLRFGYGEHYDRSRCNGAKQLRSGHSGIANDLKSIAPSGSYPRCSTADGVYDMVGNLEEWVLSGWNGGTGMLEGGAWFTVPSYADCSGRYSRQPNYRVNPRIEVFSAGFRCCWSEAAPTEQALTAGDLSADTTRRLARARARASDELYDPRAEVEILRGLWVDRYEYPNRKEVNPLVAVSWSRAVALCKAGGKRLCNAVEWERACEGPAGNKHGYANEFREHTCAVKLPAPLPTGSHFQCMSPGGGMDLIGGVWEWTASRLEPPPGLFPAGTVLHPIRGGSWYNSEGEGVCRPDLGYNSVPEHAVFEDLGFRCCRGKSRRQPLARAPARITCPPQMAAIEDFCVDRYEHPNRKGQLPTGQLTFQEAKAACRGRGRHVCTQREWNLACGGPARRHWPYGDDFDKTRCFHGQDMPERANPLMESGGFERCKTPEGVFDLAGNLWEWTDTGDRQGALRGGGVGVAAGFSRCSSRAPAAPGYNSFETGVRCCANAQEAARLLAGEAAQ